MERTSVRSAMGGIERFFSGGAFPALALSLIFFYDLLLVGLLLAPGGESGLGAFADEFRVWCFGLDPATGRLEWGYVAGMTGPPLLLAAILALLWWEPLRALLARPLALLGYVLVAAVGVGGAAGAFAALGTPAEPGELPFPAEALRTALPSPELRLTNQAGERVDLAELRGDVVMLTAVYASCPHACPLLLAQAKRVIAKLTPEERDDLRVVAVTLDPERDSTELLAQLAELQGMETPLFNLVTGEPPEVERVLDAMGIARQRDPETGIIDHASLFLLLDRRGKVAYRLTLGDRQERWLASALRLLLREPPDVG
jgi:protein SCO1/2